jgi:small subunit ribosomal protein S24e
MKIDIVNEKNNPLLKRKELSIEIEHDSAATPAKAALQHLLSKQLNKDLEFIDIRNIFSGGGVPKSKAKVFVWEEKKAQDLSKIVKVKKEAKPKEEEKPAEKKKA